MLTRMSTKLPTSQSIKYLDNHGKIHSTPYAYLMEKENREGHVHNLTKMFRNHGEATAVVVPGGIKLTVKDDFGFVVISHIILEGDYYFHNGFTLVVVPSFSLVVDNPSEDELEANPGTVDAGTVPIDILNDYLNAPWDRTAYDEPAVEPQKDSLDRFVVAGRWTDFDTAALFSFLGEGMPKPTVCVTYRHPGSPDLKVLDKLHVQFYKLSATLYPGDVVVKYNGKFAVIPNGNKMKSEPFVD